MNRGAEKRRVVVIGLDGTPHSFLKREFAGGFLPHLRKRTQQGEFLKMESEIPPISSVAWASFMTGSNPGEHGIFGFSDRRPGSYDLYFPNYSNLGVESLWDRLSRKGKRCCVLNVPSTYPARPVNGIFVSGFVAPNLERATYPNEAYEYLKSIDYRIDVDASKGKESLDLLLEDLHMTLEKRREAMLHFWKQEPWDFFMCVFTGTDRLHHFMWKRFEAEDPVYMAEFRRYYERLDVVIGEFAEELPANTVIMMLSDHGFCGIDKEVYLNLLLRDEGELTFISENPATAMDFDPGKTRAYSLDPGRIYLNLEGREPAGIVSRDDYGRVLDEVESLLLGISDPGNGKKIIGRVVRGKDFYHGTHVDAGPDLIAIPVRGYDLKGRVASKSWTGHSHLEGMHTHDDAFISLNGEWHGRTPEHIRDVAPLLLKLLES